MRKFFVVLLLCFILVGCGDKKENRNENNSDYSSNSNTSSSSSNESGEPSKPVDGKVTLYLFHSRYCSHCQEEVAWLTSIEGVYPYLDIKYYEVNDNYEFDEKVRETLGVESEGVPLTVIGSEYFVGFSEAKEKKILRTAEEQAAKGVCDVVATIEKGGDVAACIEKNKEN